MRQKVGRAVIVRNLPQNRTLVNKSVDMKNIGTHNDNFLSSFISLRNIEKKEQDKKSKTKFLPADESDETWFNKIAKMSFESEMNFEEYQSIVMDLIPEYIKNMNSSNLGNMCKHVKSSNKDARSALKNVLNRSELQLDYSAAKNMKINYQKKFNKGKNGHLVRNLFNKAFEDDKSDEDVSNVTKWKQNGIEAMIQDIQNEISNSEEKDIKGRKENFNGDQDGDSNEYKIDLKFDDIDQYLSEFDNKQSH